MIHDNKRFFRRSALALLGLIGAATAQAAAPPSASRKPPAPIARATTQARGTPALASKSSLTLDGARLAIAAAKLEASELKTTGVIAVVDDGGNLLALERIDDTFPAGANISIGKARTAALFKKPTRVFEDIIKNGRTPMIAIDDFTPLVGGVPLIADGQVVGGIGVSGASSAAQDEQLALAGAAALGSATQGPAPNAPAASGKSPGVTLFKGERVTAAFAAGSPLLETDSFKIHASRRQGPGKAEIHELDTDIAYIQEGTATLVTGGIAVDAKASEPHELRGEAIEGGETYQLTKGDVVVIPKGIPHWFKNVSTPFTYYVVKVH
jgi:glc operon protein GlcG